jgi:hypothetical protein
MGLPAQIRAMRDDDKPEALGLGPTSEYFTLMSVSSSVIDMLAAVDPRAFGVRDAASKRTKEAAADEAAVALLHRIPTGWKNEYLTTQVLPHAT